MRIQVSIACILSAGLLLAACEKAANPAGGPAGGSSASVQAASASAAAPAAANAINMAPSSVPIVDKKGCATPSWAPQRLPGYQIDDCSEQPFASSDVYLASGMKTLQGARGIVNYTLVDPSRNLSAEAARVFFMNAGIKAGAKLMTENGGYGAVLMHQTPQGEYWYIYDHGNGNSEITGGYTLTTFKIGPVLQEVQARPTVQPWDSPVTGCQDPPWLVKQFAYFKLDSCNKRDLDTMTLHLGDTDKVIAGHVYEVVYTLTDQAKDPTMLAVWQNYVNALQQIGAKLMSDPRRPEIAVLMRPTLQGEFWYVYQHGNGNSESTGTYSLITVQVGGPAPKACKVEVYGVNFDFDKSVIRPDSEPVLTQVAALFTADPAYSAEIGGHTDDIGAAAYNRTLSGARAGAVKSWLVAHGVAAPRMTTAGYGDTKPLVPNTTDDNRAKNRRVELKRVGCKG